MYFFLSPFFSIFSSLLPFRTLTHYQYICTHIGMQGYHPNQAMGGYGNQVGQMQQVCHIYSSIVLILLTYDISYASIRIFFFGLGNNWRGLSPAADGGISTTYGCTSGVSCFPFFFLFFYYYIYFFLFIILSHTHTYIFLRLFLRFLLLLFYVLVNFLLFSRPFCHCSFSFFVYYTTFMSSSFNPIKYYLLNFLSNQTSLSIA